MKSKPYEIDLKWLFWTKQIKLFEILNIQCLPKNKLCTRYDTRRTKIDKYIRYIVLLYSTWWLDCEFNK